MDNVISPILQTKINQPSSKAVVTNAIQVKPNLTNNVDAVDLSTKSKMSKTKKALIFTGSLLGIAALTVGTIIAIQKNSASPKALEKKAQKVANELINDERINNIQQEAAKVQEDAKKVIDEFLDKFNKTGKSIIQEFDKDGKTILRQADFSAGKQNFTIDNFINNTRISVDGGKLKTVQQGRKIFDNGSVETEKYFKFEDGKLIEWLTDYKRDVDIWNPRHKDFDLDCCKPENWSIGEGIYFKDGIITRWVKNLEQDDIGGLKIENELKFNEGKPAIFNENVIKSEDIELAKKKLEDLALMCSMYDNKIGVSLSNGTGINKLQEQIIKMYKCKNDAQAASYLSSLLEKIKVMNQQRKIFDTIEQRGAKLAEKFPNGSLEGPQLRRLTLAPQYLADCERATKIAKDISQLCKLDEIPKEKYSEAILDTIKNNPKAIEEIILKR